MSRDDLPRGERVPESVGAWTLPEDLRADCGRCAALCCVLHGFYESADFPIDKPPGQACPHLEGSFRCSVHDELRARGFGGCVAYECYGAGQRAVAAWGTALEDGWWNQSDIVEQLERSLKVLRPLQEMQAMLFAAEQLPIERSLKKRAIALRGELERAASAPHRELVEMDVAPLGRRADELLELVSRTVRERWTSAEGAPA